MSNNNSEDLLTIKGNISGKLEISRFEVTEGDEFSAVIIHLEHKDSEDSEDENIKKVRCIRNVNIRSGHSSSYSKVGSLVVGNITEALETFYDATKKDTWIRIGWKQWAAMIWHATNGTQYTFLELI